MDNNKFYNTNDLHSLKIFYNGIKVNGTNKLYKIEFTINKEKEEIRCYKVNCIDSIPYFGIIQRDNPLYPFFYNAAIKKEIKWLNNAYKSHIKKIRTRKLSKH